MWGSEFGQLGVLGSALHPVALGTCFLELSEVSLPLPQVSPSQTFKKEREKQQAQKGCNLLPAIKYSQNMHSRDVAAVKESRAPLQNKERSPAARELLLLQQLPKVARKEVLGKARVTELVWHTF